MRMIVCDKIEPTIDRDQISQLSGIEGAGEIFYGNDELLVLQHGNLLELFDKFREKISINIQILTNLCPYLKNYPTLF